jgi:cytochrome c oxidase accessory protein FixG
LFLLVERIVQGDRNKRKRLREGKWTFEKMYKLAITHALWLAIGWCTAGSFVLYFNDAPTLVRSFFELDVSTTVLVFIGSLTVSTYIMAGFAREQVCTFMCPYARFQSAMFDQDTMIIGYDTQRGEPRGKHKKGDSWEGRGDCINCTACVQVCPMGIDIREGLQMECIACGLCIDACDDIMDKVERPRGLIRYDTEARLDAKKEGKVEKLKFIRPRTIYYATVLLLVGGLVLFTQLTRAPLQITVLHDRNPLFVQLSSGQIRNGYDLKILNKTHDHKHYTLTIEGLDNPVIAVKSAGDVEASDLYVEADSVGQFHIFVSAMEDKGKPKDVVFRLVDSDTGFEADYESVFMTERP